MIADWLAREGSFVFAWWLMATLAAWGALPLVTRMFGALPDRGYTLARAAGVLLVGVVYWLLVTFGLTRNDSGGVVLAWGLVLAAGIAVTLHERTRHPMDWRAWWREHRAAVITVEVLFVVLFVGWALVRAHQNNLVTTEKPMDLAFMASIQRTLTFPPPDPWLSGYAISYYYLGYVFGAMFSMMSGTVPTMAYNLWTAMLFALAGVTAFGVVYNMVRSRQRDSAVRERRSITSGILAGLLGVYLLVAMGNYTTPLVDMPYFARIASPAYLSLWDVRERETPSFESNPASPQNWGYWWWFRSARVIHDRNLNDGGHTEVINEFPMFSYVLADNHPHVMALPFLVLAFGAALNIALSKRRPAWQQVIFYGVTVGALIFLNTWDTPVAIAALVGAEGLRRLRASGALTLGDWGYMLLFGALMCGITLLTYFPFLVGFQSQLGGVLPNLIHPTRFSQYFLTFGALVPLAALLIGVETWRARRDGRWNLSLGLKFGLGGLALLIVSAFVMLIAGALIPEARTAAQDIVDGAGGWGAVLPQILVKRLTHILTTLVLVTGIVLIIARLMPRYGRDERPTPKAVTYPTASGVALLFLGAALTVTLIPEFVYLRDNFGSRMNTVFKFYYQAWALFAVAGAYAVYTVLDDARLRLPALPVRIALGAVTVGALALGIFFPLYAIPERALNESFITSNPNPVLTLDGGASLTNTNDYTVLLCLRDLIDREDVVVLELAKDGSYDYFAGGIGSGRLAGITGAPTVLGWTGHQSQWRGRGYASAVGSRSVDVAQIYQDLRIDIVQALLERYGVDYVVFGQAERERYGAVGEQKFLEHYDIVCESGDSRVFRVRPLTLSTVEGSG